MRGGSDCIFVHALSIVGYLCASMVINVLPQTAYCAEFQFQNSVPIAHQPFAKHQDVFTRIPSDRLHAYTQNPFLTSLEASFPADEHPRTPQHIQPQLWTQISINVYSLNEQAYFARAILNTSTEAEMTPATDEAALDNIVWPVAYGMEGRFAHNTAPILEQPVQFELTASAYCSCLPTPLLEMEGIAKWQSAEDPLYFRFFEKTTRYANEQTFIEMTANITPTHAQPVIITSGETVLFRGEDVIKHYTGNLYLGQTDHTSSDQIAGFYLGTDYHQNGHDVLAIELSSHSRGEIREDNSSLVSIDVKRGG